MLSERSLNTREPCNTRLEIVHNCTTDLTEINKSKTSGSHTWDDNLEAKANNNNNNNNKINKYKTKKPLFRRILQRTQNL